MAELKTRETDADVCAFLESMSDEVRRRDCRRVLEIMERVTGHGARMWGASIVGFGRYHYRYASGREGDWFLTGFSPRKSDLTLYIVSGLERHGQLLSRLGKFRTGTSCLYLKRLADVDESMLEEILDASVKAVREMHPST